MRLDAWVGRREQLKRLQRLYGRCVHCFFLRVQISPSCCIYSPFYHLLFSFVSLLFISALGAALLATTCAPATPLPPLLRTRPDTSVPPSPAPGPAAASAPTTPARTPKQRRRAATTPRPGPASARKYVPYTQQLPCSWHGSCATTAPLSCSKCVIQCSAVPRSSVTASTCSAL
jgi:hypothetical protein